MPKNGTDPVEERDIEKILGALDDERVVAKIANALALTKIEIPIKNDTESQPDISVKTTIIVPKSTLK